jgi:hypothetical protein
MSEVFWHSSYFDVTLMYYTFQISLYILVAGNTHYRNRQLYMRHAAMQFKVDYIVRCCILSSHLYD